MTQKPRRLFTDKQKAEAVRIMNQSGKPVSQVAKEMGLTKVLCANGSNTRLGTHIQQVIPITRLTKLTKSVIRLVKAVSWTPNSLINSLKFLPIECSNPNAFYKQPKASFFFSKDASFFNRNQQTESYT